MQSSAGRPIKSTAARPTRPSNPACPVGRTAPTCHPTQPTVPPLLHRSLPAPRSLGSCMLRRCAGAGRAARPQRLYRLNKVNKNKGMGAGQCEARTSGRNEHKRHCRKKERKKEYARRRGFRKPAGQRRWSLRAAPSTRPASHPQPRVPASYPPTPPAAQLTLPPHVPRQRLAAQHARRVHPHIRVAVPPKLRGGGLDDVIPLAHAKPLQALCDGPPRSRRIKGRGTREQGWAGGRALLSRCHPATCQ